MHSALSHSAAMRGPARVGLGRLPSIEPAITSPILAPDEAPRPDARCPRPQCRVTDGLLCEAYDTAAHLLPIFRLGKMVPYIQFLRLLGGLKAASAVVPLGLLSLRPMQMGLNSRHLDAKWHMHRRVRVSQRCLHSLSRWRDRAYLLMGVPRGAIQSRQDTVTADAYLSGWGAVWRGRTAQGQWSAQEGAWAYFCPTCSGRQRHGGVPQVCVPLPERGFTAASP